ncbi:MULTISPECIES: hypothetical protein [Acinetobacter]|jgi:hypothetical protein|uniref:hypothetical protein n=2 Tax=Moraxellaceae TaxID=468 RepID=UPI00044E7331|nr:MULTISPECIES: hypothetical protein [Acinetobacter]EXE53298.1 hypothetical protein J579_3280 [Acinetobacter sp. 1239920]MCU4597223.1 hypothetical protein [Acinetobacter radioresistens]
MQVQFNKRSISPSVFKKDDKIYFSTTVFSPVRYNLNFGEGMMPVEQMKSVLEQCAENAQDVEIEFTESQTKFGPVMQIFSVKPLPKKNPTQSNG